MNTASKKLCLILASAAFVVAGCSKKPKRPDPSSTVLGPTGGGAITQWLGWMGVHAGGHHGEWRIGLGQQRALRSGTANPVVELSWTRTFMLSGR